MRPRAWVLAAVLACLCAAAAPMRAAACGVPVGFEGAPLEIVNETNVFRIAEGRDSLRPSPRLTRAAQSHACFMAATGTFSHTGANDSQVGDRATAAGFSWRYIAENIAFGQPFAAGAFGGWKTSPGHRKNMLSANAREIGIGLAANRAGRLYWVMVLGAAR